MGLTVYAGGNPEVINRMAEKNADKNANNEKRRAHSIFAGNLNLQKEDSVEEKKRQAKQKAWKVVSEAWENEKSIEDTIQKRRDLYDEMSEVQKQEQTSVNELNKAAKDLQEQYGVEDDSKEQQDLELLKKKNDISNGVSDSMLTDEEMERLKDIDMSSLTEYQKRALEINDRAVISKKNLREAKIKMQDAVSDITSIQLERLKTHPMTDAKKQADAILYAAGKEIISDIAGEGMENIDEKLAEEEEKAEKEAQKKEEKEEELEEIKEKRALEKAIIMGTKEAIEEAKAVRRENNAPQIDIDSVIDITKSDPQGDDVKKSLEDIKNSMNLLEADLSGIKVDEIV